MIDVNSKSIQTDGVYSVGNIVTTKYKGFFKVIEIIEKSDVNKPYRGPWYVYKVKKIMHHDGRSLKRDGSSKAIRKWSMRDIVSPESIAKWKEEGSKKWDTVLEGLFPEKFERKGEAEKAEQQQGVGLLRSLDE